LYFQQYIVNDYLFVLVYHGISTINNEKTLHSKTLTRLDEHRSTNQFSIDLIT